MKKSDKSKERVKAKCEEGFLSYMEMMIATLKRRGREGTAETYKTAMESFRHYRGGKDLGMEKLTEEETEGYESWLRERGVMRNTVSFYMRILRAVYNRAVDAGLTEQRHPFRRVYTGIDRTEKRALTLSQLRGIKNLDLRRKPNYDYARDMFMMSFYLRGMSLVDMAYLREQDLRNGRIVYRRRKTGQELIIQWTVEMQRILDKYGGAADGYLLPILKKFRGNERGGYKNAGYNINYSLKKIGMLAGVEIPLTLYAARHSWASIARAKGVPLRVISEGMGHESEKTTRIYLRQLDTRMVDSANAMIIGSI